MTTALDDRAGIVFPRGFYMPRVHCVQVGLSDDLARLPPPGGHFSQVIFSHLVFDVFSVSVFVLLAKHKRI